MITHLSGKRETTKCCPALYSLRNDSRPPKSLFNAYLPKYLNDVAQRKAPTRGSLWV